MSPRFNVPSTGTATTNLAGGAAFSVNAEFEFASIALTSMLTDQFYRKADDTIERVRELMDHVSTEFAAKTALVARNEYGMRSISHLIAGEIALRVKGERWTRPFFTGVVRRVDDMTEILAYLMSRTPNGKRPIPNSLKDGLAHAFDKFDAYQLSRYRGEGNALTLIDLVNLVRPKPTDRNREALALLMKNELRSTETWESRLTAAGSDVEAKRQVWVDLISTRSIGYFALLRNLRNISEQAPDVLDAALDMLVDANLIRKSLVLPFRFSTAAAQFVSTPGAGKIITALGIAAEIALENVPVFDGRTLIVLDSSGSMTMTRVGRGQTLVADVAALFASALYKRSEADIIEFSTDAEYVTPRSSNLLGIAQELRNAMAGGGTNFHAAFRKASQAYDRVIILSDMQGWNVDAVYGRFMPGGSPLGQTMPAIFNEFATRTGKRPIVYSFDLAGYGTIQFPENNVFLMAGFSDRAFETMKLLETDRNALINKIKAVEFVSTSADSDDAVEGGLPA